MTAPDTDHERARLVARIRTAFADVSRDGGMSWSDSWESDGGPASDCPLYPDADRHWSDLINDPRWTSHYGWGGFSFLDAIGARYYMPVALTHVVLGRETHDIASHLSGGMHKSGDIARDTRWSLLTADQWRCVQEVAEFMAANGFAQSDDWAYDSWTTVAANASTMSQHRR